ncbi:DUF1653 domain-containing protein [Bdellovibrio sp. HCB288]|uniref:DUF1653 domain-containing protein n=1 Tax=Bdellovibrio sp. HCB288 TaxID=3394355 RepID=UPI0039B5C54C
MQKPKAPVSGAIYKHYKGKFYRVIGVGKHSETMEDIVLYECLYENSLGRLWARPLELWSSPIEVDGKMVPRFEFQYE